MNNTILDTSIFIATEVGRPLQQPVPELVGVSVVTLAELELGVLVAREPATRARRLRTLSEVRKAIAGIPIDERIASVYAELAALAIAANRKPRINDTWIAATAAVMNAQVWTQDRDFSDFDQRVEIVFV